MTETNDALTVSLSDPASFTEGSATAATVLSASDPDGGEITYSISDTTYYEIDADRGYIDRGWCWQIAVRRCLRSL